MSLAIAMKGSHCSTSNRAVRFRDAAQQEESMHTAYRIRIVQIALRLSLAAAFLSAVADRFGWWAPFGQGNWGSMGPFADYAHQLVPFAYGWFLRLF
jgi:hypothetical protein